MESLFDPALIIFPNACGSNQGNGPLSTLESRQVQRQSASGEKLKAEDSRSFGWRPDGNQAGWELSLRNSRRLSHMNQGERDKQREVMTHKLARSPLYARAIVEVAFSRIPAARSISSSVVIRPTLSRTAPLPTPDGTFMARNTADCVTWPSRQADPVDAAISGTFASNSLPIWSKKFTFNVFGNRFSGWPLRIISSSSPASRVA
jgi:hypothetical protein